MFDIQDIKALRKKLGLTQSDLAKRSGVSQSMIAKIESGSIDPSYSKYQKIIKALSSIDESTDLTAKDIMTKKVISASPDILLPIITRAMRSNAISQMPIVRDNLPVGLVSERCILDALDSGKDFRMMQCKDVMDSAPPTISPNSSVAVIKQMLHHFSLLLVSDDGKIVGLITKADLIANMRRL